MGKEERVDGNRKMNERKKEKKSEIDICKKEMGEEDEETILGKQGHEEG